MHHKPTRLDRVRPPIRLNHDRLWTAHASVARITRCSRCHHTPHPAAMGASERRPWRTPLAVARQVPASTQRQALSARVLLDRAGRHQDGGGCGAIAPAKRPERVPVVCSRAAGRAVLAPLDGPPWLRTRVRDGAGRRLMAGVRWRVQEVDVACRHSLGRDGQGHPDRATMRPQALLAPGQPPLAKGKALG